MRLVNGLIAALIAGVAMGADGAGRAAGGGPAASASPAAGPPWPLQAAHGCLASGNGYLRAKIRGALQLDVNFHDSELACDGGARPDGSGIRVSFAGPQRSDGRRLRIVFGIAGASEGSGGRELPTNLTVIFEGEERIFATRGPDKCTVDELRQERFAALAGPVRSYRVVARGFCIAPVNGLKNTDRIFVESFDFAGSVTFDTSP